MEAISGDSLLGRINHLLAAVLEVRSNRTFLRQIYLVVYRGSKLLPQLRLLESIHDIS